MSNQRKNVKSAREKDIEDENSPSFLRWQLKTLLSENLKSRQEFVDRCVTHEENEKCLEDEIRALKTELESVIKEARTLKDNLQQSQQSEETTKKTNSELKKDLERRKERNQKLLQEFSEYREKSEKIVEELEEKLNNTKARMEEERGRLSKGIKEQQEEIKTVRTMAEALQTEYNHLMDNHKTALAKFKLIIEMNGVANGVLNSKLHTIEADLKEKELKKIESLKRRINLKDEKIRKLEELKELEGTVRKLTATVAQNEKTIEGKDSEIRTMAEEMRDLVAKNIMKGQMAAVLQCKLTEAEEQIHRLEEEKGQRDSTAQSLLAENLQRLDDNKRLQESLTQSQNRLRLSEADNRKLDGKVRELERCQAQFRADLNMCVSVMGKPKELKLKLAALKRRYINDERGIKLAEDTEVEYQSRIQELQHRLHCQAKTCRNQERTMRKMQQRMESLDAVAAAREIHYIQLLNSEISKTQDLQKKVQEDQLQSSPS